MLSLNFLGIFIGGGLGALSRYGLSIWLNNKVSWEFPIATLFVNVLGCFLMGILYAYFRQNIDNNFFLNNFLAIGFLGAFTTFSTFSLETLLLIEENHVFLASLNILSSMFLGLIAIFFGMKTVFGF